MMDKTDLIDLISTKLLSGDVATAKKQIISGWEFKPLPEEPSRETIPESRQIQVFFRVEKRNDFKSQDPWLVLQSF